MPQQVLAIYVCPDKGLDMKRIDSVKAIKGIGLEGDRYALNKGVYSKSKPKIRHVSLIAIEAIETANKGLKKPFYPSDTRRQIVTEGIDLNSLIGKEFKVGDVIMRGTELCDPCRRPSILSKKPGFETAFFGRGGLRAEVLSSGVICTGDPINLIHKESLLFSEEETEKMKDRKMLDAFGPNP